MNIPAKYLATMFLCLTPPDNSGNPIAASYFRAKWGLPVWANQR